MTVREQKAVIQDQIRTDCGMCRWIVASVDEKNRFDCDGVWEFALTIVLGVYRAAVAPW